MTSFVLLFSAVSVCLWPSSHCFAPNAVPLEDLTDEYDDSLAIALEEEINNAYDESLVLLQTGVQVKKVNAVPDPSVWDFFYTPAFVNGLIFVFSLVVAIAMTNRSSEKARDHTPDLKPLSASRAQRTNPPIPRRPPDRLPRPKADLANPRRRADIPNVVHDSTPPAAPQANASKAGDQSDHATRMEQQRVLISLLQKDFPEQLAEESTASACATSDTAVTGDHSPSLTDLSAAPTARELHERGECKPCAYFWLKEDGCRWGDTCEYCHLCDRDALKRRKKEKKLKMKDENWVYEFSGMRARAEQSVPAGLDTPEYGAASHNYFCGYSDFAYAAHSEASHPAAAVLRSSAAPFVPYKA